LRLVFFGSPAFAIPTLDALVREHEIVLAVAQPDKPAGRGMQVQRPAVAARASERGLPLAQPPKVRDPKFLERVERLAPDAGIVIAYGKILPAALLAIPKFGFLNVHASLLPKYRGAAPIQRAIANGERVTGVTIMRVDEELDHGPMLAKAETPIGPDEHMPSLAQRLSTIGAESLLAVLDQLARGTAVETPQDHALATIAPKIDKSEGEVRWSDPARAIYDRFRAFDAWPGIFTRAGLKLIEVEPATGHADPGTIVAIGTGVTVAAGDGALRIVTMQRPGKPRAAAADVARGLGWRVGARLP